MSAVLEGRHHPGAFTHTAGALTITPATPMALDEERSFAVSYQGQPTAGLYYAPDNQRVAFTFTEPFDARHWFPCRDVPDDKADWYRGRINAPDDVRVASNGARLSVVDNGNGTKTTIYFHDEPIATYLISMAVSAYQTSPRPARAGSRSSTSSTQAMPWRPRTTSPTFPPW